MAQQIFRQPTPRRRDEDEQIGPEIQRPSGEEYSRSSYDSSDANNTLSNIDNVLAQNESNPVRSSTNASIKPDLPGIKNSEHAAHKSPADALTQGSLGAGAAGGLAGGADKLGKGFTGAMPQAEALKGFSKVKDKLWGTPQRKRNTTLGGGIGGGIIALVMILFMSFLPYKINLMFTKMQNRYGAAAAAAAKDASNHIRDEYLEHAVLASLGANCPTTKTKKSCTKISGVKSSNPVFAALASLHDTNFEGKLAEKYGIEFRSVGSGSTRSLYMSAPGLPSDSIRLPDNFATGNGDLRLVMPQQARQALDDALANETKFQRMILRYRLRGLMKEHGILRCTTECNPLQKARNAVHEGTKELRRAAALLIAQRVLQPFSASLGLAVACIITTDCHPERIGEDRDANGNRLTPYQRQIADSLDKFAQKFGQQALKDLLASSNEFLEKGFARYTTDKLVESMGSRVGASDAAKGLTKATASKAIPFIGWANLAAETIEFVKTLDMKRRALVYATKLPTYIALWQTYRTLAEETNSGKVDLQKVGSFASSLAASADGPGAEASPLYGEIMGSSTNAGTAWLQHFLPPKAYAAAKKSQNSALNFCDKNAVGDNKSSVPPGKLVCPEETLMADSTFTKDVEDSIPAPVAEIARYWNGSVGAAIRALGGVLGAILSSIPGVEKLSALLGKALEPLFNYLMTKAVPSPFNDHMSGARKFNIAAGGGNALNNQYCQKYLGCKKATPKQAADAINRMVAEQRNEFERKSFFARMFDSGSEYSFVSQVALALPTNVQTTAQTSVASLLSNPFAKLFGSFASMFTQNRANAAVTPGEDPFGITQYVFPTEEIPRNPSQYWEKNCADGKKTEKWQDKLTQSPLTGSWDNTTTNPCMLFKEAAIGISAITGVQDGSGAPTNTTGIPTGTAQQLALQILSNPNISFQLPQWRTAMEKIAQTGHGTTCGNPAIDPRVLGILLAASQKYKIVVGVIVDGHSCNFPAPHPYGRAVDINGVNRLDGSAGGTGNRIEWVSAEMPILREFYTLLDSLLAASGGGTLQQAQCFKDGPDPAASPGVRHGRVDTCNHLHMDVSKK